MTLNQRHKQLSELIAQGLGRRQVCIDKTSFTDNLEGDGCVILPVCRVDTALITKIDGDGWAITNKDGSERERLTILLGGANYTEGKERSHGK